MDLDAAQTVSETHPRKSSWTKALLLLLSTAFLIFFALNLLKHAPNPPGFTVGAPLAPGKVVPQLSYNYFNTIAFVASDGSLWRWESARSSDPPHDPPQQVGSDSDWCQVAAILSDSLALKADGSLWAWGANHSGALAQRDATLRTNDPIRIGSDTNWSQIAVGAGHCLALKRDGSLWAWGQNDRGQVGDGTKSNKFAITQIGPDHDWSRIAAGHFSSLALKNDGSLWGWGYFKGPAGDDLSPRRIDPGKFVAISASDYVLLALRVDGTLWVGGPNAPSAARAYVSVPTPYMIQVGKDTDWSEIYAGTQGFFARKKDSTWWFSGKMQNGASLATPTRLPMSFDPWSFAPKLGDALILTRDGTIWLLTVEPDTGKYAATIKKLKTLLNQASAVLPGRPKFFNPNNFPIRPGMQRIWTVPVDHPRVEEGHP